MPLRPNRWRRAASRHDRRAPHVLPLSQQTLRHHGTATRVDRRSPAHGGQRHPHDGAKPSRAPGIISRRDRPAPPLEDFAPTIPDWALHPADRQRHGDGSWAGLSSAAKVRSWYQSRLSRSVHRGRTDRGRSSSVATKPSGRQISVMDVCAVSLRRLSRSAFAATCFHPANKSGLAMRQPSGWYLPSSALFNPPCVGLQRLGRFAGCAPTLLCGVDSRHCLPAEHDPALHMPTTPAEASDFARWSAVGWDHRRRCVHHVQSKLCGCHDGDKIVARLP